MSPSSAICHIENLYVGPSCSRCTKIGGDAPVDLVLGDLGVTDTQAGTVGQQAMADVNGRCLASVTSVLQWAQHM